VAGHVKTQLIAHDKEVYDIAFSRAGGGRDMFASVGADGSVRMFDLRHLEHSTIIYEVGRVHGVKHDDQFIDITILGSCPHGAAALGLEQTGSELFSHRCHGLVRSYNFRCSCSLYTRCKTEQSQSVRQRYCVGAA